MTASLEHVNFTVPDPNATAEILIDLFGWTLRWEGGSIHDGHSVHVGNAQTYLALYTPKTPLDEAGDSYHRTGGLNHIGLTVPDLDAAEATVRAAGYVPRNHADYEPGRRFYFDGPDGIEYEIVSYNA